MKPKIRAKDFRAAPGKKVHLKKWPTRIAPFYRSKDDYKEAHKADIAELKARQGLLYASSSYALLVVFQAMDAGGKDGCIKHVLSGINPQGCVVTSFKQPSAEELSHDFLWRAVRCLPERGRIGIFNRSYYEEVLIVRVHPELLEAQRLPPKLRSGHGLWRHRFDSIVELEKHLHRSGTRVLKVFLHLSKGEQRRRFLARIDDPDKNWKLTPADIEERKRWADYAKAYERCLEATSTRMAPWHIVPADDKENARMIVSRILIEALEEMKLAYPQASGGRRRELKAMRSRLRG